MSPIGLRSTNDDSFCTMTDHGFSHATADTTATTRAKQHLSSKDIILEDFSCIHSCHLNKIKKMSLIA